MKFFEISAVVEGFTRTVIIAILCSKRHYRIGHDKLLQRGAPSECIISNKRKFGTLFKINFPYSGASKSELAMDVTVFGMLIFSICVL